MPRVFVYGTLKSGFGNHYLLDGCRFVEAIAEGFELHASSNLPFVKEGIGTVKGELYEVTLSVLERLDHLEGHPNFYNRVCANVQTIHNKKIPAWIYVYHDAGKFPLIESGEWKK